MSTFIRRLLSGAALAGAAWLLAGAGSAGPPKGAGWKPILPLDTFKELVKRTAKVAEEGLNAGDENGLAQASGSAVVITIAAFSVKGGDTDEVLAIRIAGLELSQLTKDKAKRKEAKTLAATLAAGKVEPETKNVAFTLNKEVLADVMSLYHPKAKGGEGLPESLQNPAPFKTAKNSLEEKIFYLAKKELKPEVLDRDSSELALLAYKTAVIGALTEKFAPVRKVGKRDPAVWHQLSVTMRDAGVELAEAAKKKDAAGVRKAADVVGNTCTECHSVFRK